MSEDLSNVDTTTLQNKMRLAKDLVVATAAMLPSINRFEQASRVRNMTELATFVQAAEVELFNRNLT